MAWTKTKKNKVRKWTKKAVRKAVKPVVYRTITAMAEKKYFEQSATDMAVTQSWNLMTLITKPGAAGGGLAQGTSANQRLGNKIFVSRIEFSVQLYKNSGTEANGDTCRCIMYHNKEAKGAVIDKNTLFAEDKVYSLRAYPNNPMASVVKDAVHTFVPTASTGTAGNYAMGPQVVFRWNIYPRKRIDFNGTYNDVRDLIKDDYGIGCIATGNNCLMSWRSRVYFSDM